MGSPRRLRAARERTVMRCSRFADAVVTVDTMGCLRSWRTLRTSPRPCDIRSGRGSRKQKTPTGDCQVDSPEAQKGGSKVPIPPLLTPVSVHLWIQATLWGRCQLAILVGRAGRLSLRERAMSRRRHSLGPGAQRPVPDIGPLVLLSFLFSLWGRAARCAPGLVLSPYCDLAFVPSDRR